MGEETLVLPDVESAIIEGATMPSGTDGGSGGPSGSPTFSFAPSLSLSLSEAPLASWGVGGALRDRWKPGTLKLKLRSAGSAIGFGTGTERREVDGAGDESGMPERLAVVPVGFGPASSGAEPVRLSEGAILTSAWT